MSSVTALNVVMLIAALAASVALTWTFGIRENHAAMATESSDTQTVIEDAQGTPLPIRRYDRIASASTIADEVLIQIIEPRRLLAVSRHTLEYGHQPWRYEGKVGIGSSKDIETIIDLEPDIVFVNGFVDVRHLERLKDGGVRVFNLGEMRGVSTLTRNIEQVATVVDAAERGQDLIDDFTRRMAAIAAHLPEDQRFRALYVGIHGDRLYGGTRDTSFHDVLTAAGLVDVAAEAGYTGWPAYNSEQLLELDPPWIITNESGVDALCEHAGFSELSACKTGQVRAIDDDLLTDPGLGMLRAAEAVHAAVYP